jgi:hypothetical protein
MYYNLLVHGLNDLINYNEQDILLYFIYFIHSFYYLSNIRTKFICLINSLFHGIIYL